MQKNKNKIKHLSYFNEGDKPSPFVVDLKKQLSEKYDKRDENNNINTNTVYKKISSIKDKAVKIKEKANRPIKIEKNKIQKELVVLAKSAVGGSKHPIGKIVSAAGKNRKEILMFSEILGRTFIQSLGKKIKKFSPFKIVRFIFKPFYRICYKIGWTFLFIVRLFYFAFLHPVKIFLNKFIKLSVLEKGLVAEYEKDKILPASIYPMSMPLVKAEFSKEEIGKILGGSLNKKTKITKKEPISYSLLLEKISPKFSFRLFRPTFVFAVMLLVLIVPFKIITFYHSLNLDELRGRVLGASEDAFSNLFSAGNDAGNFNFSGAKENFGQAADNFLKAQDELSSIDNLLFTLASISPNKELKLAGESKKILAAGEKASELGGNLSEAANILFAGSASGKNFGDILKSFTESGEKAITNANELSNIITDIDKNNLPEEYRQRFSEAKEQIVLMGSGLEQFVDLVKNLRIILGAEEDKRYLLVFQNNAEARPTGGFIGSFALADFKNGQIKNLEVPTGGSYDTEAGLRRTIEAPEPLHLVNPLWHFWDANWWPDWPTSARKLEWFYEKSNGPTVDGVISFTPTVMERILGAIGPIEMPEYGLTMTQENFWVNTRSAIEEGKNEFEASQKATSTPVVAEKPKKIIGDLMQKMIKEMPNRLNKETLANLIKVFGESLEEKHILIYFNDKELQTKLSSYGWDGGIRKSSKDYLSVVSTNIGGGKSDRKIKETIHHEAEVMADGSIVDTIKIERFHDSIKYADSSGVRNINWLRVYVPLGSKLIEASGFEKPSEIYFEKPEAIYEKDPDIAKSEKSAIIDEASGTEIYVESGKTVFANWSMVDPGDTDIIYLKYQLPFSLKSEERNGLFDKIYHTFKSENKNIYSYSLLTQKQAGAFNTSKIESELKIPANMKINWNYPENMNIKNSGWEVKDYLKTDKYWAVVIEE